MEFDDPAIHQYLDVLDPDGLNALPFGAVGLTGGNIVEFYNTFESQLSGLAVERVVGRHFFNTIAPCMNNYMVAGRFDNEPSLDVTIPYVLTLRIQYTPVLLRLLRQPDRSRRWLLVRRG